MPGSITSTGSFNFHILEVSAPIIVAVQTRKRVPSRRLRRLPGSHRAEKRHCRASNSGPPGPKPGFPVCTGHRAEESACVFLTWWH